MNFERIVAERPEKTIYKDGNTVIKVFNENFSKADILNEALNHARVEEIGLKIPKVIEVKKVDGKWVELLGASGEKITFVAKDGSYRSRQNFPNGKWIKSYYK